MEKVSAKQIGQYLVYKKCNRIVLQQGVNSKSQKKPAEIKHHIQW